MLLICKLFRTFVCHEDSKHINDDIAFGQLCHESQRFCHNFRKWVYLL